MSCFLWGRARTGTGLLSVSALWGTLGEDLVSVPCCGSTWGHWKDLKFCHLIKKFVSVTQAKQIILSSKLAPDSAQQKCVFLAEVRKAFQTLVVIAVRDDEWVCQELNSLSRSHLHPALQQI